MSCGWLNVPRTIDENIRFVQPDRIGQHKDIDVKAGVAAFELGFVVAAVFGAE